MTHLFSFLVESLIISTHILTKRMTSFCMKECNYDRYFNSHPHEEDDVLNARLLSRRYYFNSHPHEEDDLLFKAFAQSLQYFNSHPHEEDDKNIKAFKIRKRYFNSHPHEEDDFLTMHSFTIHFISTHILTKRMTPVSEITSPS